MSVDLQNMNYTSLATTIITTLTNLISFLNEPFKEASEFGCAYLYNDRYGHVDIGCLFRPYDAPTPTDTMAMTTLRGTLTGAFKILSQHQLSTTISDVETNDNLAIYAQGFKDNYYNIALQDSQSAMWNFNETSYNDFLIIAGSDTTSDDTLVPKYVASVTNNPTTKAIVEGAKKMGCALGANFAETEYYVFCVYTP